MKMWRAGSAWSSSPCIVRTFVALLSLIAAAPPMHALQFAPVSGSHEITLAEYRQHLADLDSIVGECQAQRAAQKQAEAPANACDPARVGPDDGVKWPAGGSQLRQVRYDWLRAALLRAAKPGSSDQQNIPALGATQKKVTVSVAELLVQARQRLQFDEEQASNPAEAAANYSAERRALDAILAQKTYQGVSKVSARERFVEWIDNLLDRFLATLVRLGSHAPWIGWILRILLLAAICIGLLWFLLRIERNARIRLVPEVVPAQNAPSAREWQLWLRDAETMAASGQWRDAIHLLYWASIARLESMRLWPADRARTPREYLALMASSDPRRASLAELTQRFEHTWYGGRMAADSDFEAARKLAAALGVAPA